MTEHCTYSLIQPLGFAQWQPYTERLIIGWFQVVYNKKKTFGDWDALVVLLYFISCFWGSLWVRQVIGILTDSKQSSFEKEDIRPWTCFVEVLKSVIIFTLKYLLTHFFPANLHQFSPSHNVHGCSTSRSVLVKLNCLFFVCLTVVDRKHLLIQMKKQLYISKLTFPWGLSLLFASDQFCS